MKQAPWLDAAQQQWQQLGPRDRRALLWCGALVALALLWWVALAPAISTWRQAPARIDSAQQTLLRLQDMAQEAQALQSQAREPGAGTPLERLRQASTMLGSAADINAQGDALVVSVIGVKPEALSSWLAQVRLNARLKPAQVRWQAADDGLWSGTVVFATGAP
jgi:general secretion pathway protein M